jgi:hypothetical protein
MNKNVQRLQEAKSAYAYGFENGYSIAVENIPDYNLTNEDETEQFISDCFETESEHFRQFTPFEFYAHDFNESEDPDFTWDAYNRGVYRGILIALSE